MSKAAIIEGKIMDFFKKFSEEKGENVSKIKLVIQLIDESTINLVPTYSVHSDNVSEYCFIQAIIKLSIMEKLVVSYQDINNKIGKYFVEKANFHKVDVNTIKGMIAVKNGTLIAGLFIDKKFISEFKVEDFIN